MTAQVSLCLSLPLLLLSVPVAVADSSPSLGAALVNACAACHGPDGRSRGAIPSFNTLPKDGLVEALRAFRSGERQGTVMNRIAKGLEDTDIEAIAAHVGLTDADESNRRP
jgi:cytochrome subunit of sulfide dehydrogenase